MIGKTLSRYKIVSKLGEGGMGEVYCAEDTELGREVALKILPLRKESPERVERFRREARAIASLNHPNIVTLYNVEEAEGRRLLVMERVEGKSLDRLIPPEGMPLAEVFASAIPMADALAAAHARGITHRDLKPSNVMLTDAGQVKVLDFGLAKLAADRLEIPLEGQTTAPTQSAALTGEGTVMGTAPYMSPEQLSGKVVDSRTDIFSFGILLYEMITGRRPFQGDTGVELASSILKDIPASVVEVREDLPRHLGRIIQHCLEKDPERRFQSAKDIRNELEVLEREVDAGVLTTGPGGPVSTVNEPASTARRPTGLYVALGAVGLVFVLAFIWWQGRAPSPQQVAVAPSEAAGPRTVAVLPFANLGADETLDYLSLAVPDEIATALSRGSGLAIRPFSSTSRLDPEGLDPLTIGRDLGVATVVTGQYFQEGEQLSLTLEAIDVEGNSVAWRDSVVVNSQELLSLRQAVAAKVERGLMPLLAPAVRTVSAGTLPTNEEAYDLYLRSLPATSDAAANAEAMAMVERAVELDPRYAPAWAQLARRYYFYGQFGGGGDGYIDRSIEAAKRAVELDPELIEPQVRLIIVSVERGELVAAYGAADRLIAQRPRAGRAHWVRSYVLRYAGALEEALRDCDTALVLEPNNAMFRSCGVTNSLAGRHARALQFVALGAGTDYGRVNRAVILMRQGESEQAAELSRQSSWLVFRAYDAHHDGQPLGRDVLQQIVATTLAVRDSESQYWNGSVLAQSGEHGAGLRLIREGIERGYCSYPFMTTDPLLANLRADPEMAEGFAEAQAAGKACHEQFVAAISAG